MKTKILKDRMERVRNRVGLPNCFSINLVEKSGGLALCWTSNVALEVVNFSNSHVHAIIPGEGL